MVQRDEKTFTLYFNSVQCKTESMNIAVFKTFSDYPMISSYSILVKFNYNKSTFKHSQKKIKNKKTKLNWVLKFIS